MKKITVSVLALFAFAGATYAQTPDLKLGAKAGLNITNLSGLDHSKGLTGFHVGAIAEIFITEKFSIQPEILYSSQGGKTSENYEYLDGVINKMENKYKLDYLNIPIMAKYYVMEGLSVQAGPQIGFNVKAEKEYKDLDLSGTDKIKDEINSVDFGLNFGVGYELPLGVFADARYNLGLSKVNKEGKSFTNGVFQISVGYKF